MVVFGSQYGLLHLARYLIERHNSAIFVAFNSANQVIVSVKYLDRFDRLVLLDHGDVGQIPDTEPNCSANIAYSNCRQDDAYYKGSAQKQAKGLRKATLFSMSG
jgi:hypothetical protein